MGPIPAEKMTAAQKQAAEDHTKARGSLTGPWNVLLRSPELMGRVRGLSDYVRFNGALPPRLQGLGQRGLRLDLHTAARA